VDWHHDDRAERLINFVRKLTGLRHRFPILRRTRFLSGNFDEDLGVKDVAWINATGEEMKEENWKDAHVRCFGMLLDGRAQTTGIRKRGELATLLIIFNPWQDVVKFKLPKSNGGDSWTLVADTNFPDSPDEPAFPIGHEYEVTARSLLLFALNHNK
jgi:glycogen operon protein